MVAVFLETESRAVSVLRDFVEMSTASILLLELCTALGQIQGGLRNRFWVFMEQQVTWQMSRYDGTCCRHLWKIQVFSKKAFEIEIKIYLVVCWPNQQIVWLYIIITLESYIYGSSSLIPGPHWFFSFFFHSILPSFLPSFSCSGCWNRIPQTG